MTNWLIAGLALAVLTNTYTMVSMGKRITLLRNDVRHVHGHVIRAEVEKEIAQIVSRGRAAGKTDEEIKADLDARHREVEEEAVFAEIAVNATRPSRNKWGWKQ